LAVADRLDRRWIGVDNSIMAIQTMLERFLNGTERMGDFVSDQKKNRNLNQKNGQETLPLFTHNPSEDKNQNTQHLSGHHPITDFVLYSDVRLQDELEQGIKKWFSPAE
jgi:adenine-specific DNA-methyltransferase